MYIAAAFFFNPPAKKASSTSKNVLIGEKHDKWNKIFDYYDIFHDGY